MSGSEQQLPPDLLDALSREQRAIGEGLFRFALAFILLHELGHLRLGHMKCTGPDSITQEKDADRFAIDWLIGSSPITRGGRLNCLLGSAVALLWLTIFNVYLGPGTSATHPPAYDRLFQVLDQAILTNDEADFVWEFVAMTLFSHMDNAGYDFEAERMQVSPREEVNYLIDVLSQQV